MYKRLSRREFIKAAAIASLGAAAAGCTRLNPRGTSLPSNQPVQTAVPLAVPEGTADMILRNGRVLTIDPQGSIAQAVAWKDSLIMAAGTDQVWYLSNNSGFSWEVVTMTFVPDTNRTAHDTNYTDISVEAPSGTEVASEQTTTGDTGNLTAGTPLALAQTTSGPIEVDDGEAIAFKKTDAGTGLALDGAFVLWCREIRI